MQARKEFMRMVVQRLGDRAPAIAVQPEASR